MVLTLVRNQVVTLVGFSSMNSYFLNIPRKTDISKKRYRTGKMNKVLSLILKKENGLESIEIKKGQQNCQPFHIWIPLQLEFAT